MMEEVQDEDQDVEMEVDETNQAERKAKDECPQ